MTALARNRWLAGQTLAQSLSRLPNLRLPTLGGRHFWMDVEVAASHRIQRHVWTGHCRLLDRHDRRWASGTIGHCRSAARRIFPPPTRVGTLVVLLHGLYRSRHSLARLERRLNEAGWITIAPNYPSGHADLPALGAWLNRVMNGLAGCERVVFVTYSLGGLVLRSALGRDSPWRHRIAVAGVVQIGTPNRGAQAAALLRGLPEEGGIAGPAARALCRPIDLPEPPPGIPVAVIAGGNGRDGFNPFLEGDDDGVVRVAETRLARDHDFHLVPTLHGLLTGHPATEALVRAALEAWTAEPAVATPGVAPAEVSRRATGSAGIL